MKFAGDNHYREQVKCLHFRRNWNRNEGAGHERNLNQCQSVLLRCQTGADALRMNSQFHCRCDRGHSFTFIYLKISLINFLLRFLQPFFIHRTIIQHLSTANIDTVIRLFVHCAFLACHGNISTETFTTNVEQRHRRRHHMTARGL